MRILIQRRRIATGLINPFAMALALWGATQAFVANADSDNVIEKQLADIGGIPNEEVVVVQRKYTRKQWRHEFTPVALGGLPFGTVRRSLMGGASYTLHMNDWLGFESPPFTEKLLRFLALSDTSNRFSTWVLGLRPRKRQRVLPLFPGSDFESSTKSGSPCVSTSETTCIPRRV
jgi:hypothetical protein